MSATEQFLLKNGQDMPNFPCLFRPTADSLAFLGMSKQCSLLWYHSSALHAGADFSEMTSRSTETHSIPTCKDGHNSGIILMVFDAKAETCVRPRFSST
jgi:hypothetical protein